MTTEAECKELHDWLWTKYQLLERVIRARKLHHSRFFSQNMDYGHVKFLDQLKNQKIHVTYALEKLERRTTEVCQYAAIFTDFVLTLLLSRFYTKTNNGSNGYENARMMKKHIGKKNRRE